MPATNVHTGVCDACKNQLVCTYPVANGRVLRCGQFESFEATLPETNGKGYLSSRRLRPFGANQANIDTHLGICGNCENSESCTYPKPAGGVWRCEEYR